MSERESRSESGSKRARSAAKALDVVRADPESVVRQRRRRMLWRSVIITFVLIFGWIGVLVVLQAMTNPAYNFRVETRQVLERIRDGEAETVYRDASPLLREAMLLDRFLEVASDIRGTLGGFREILAIKQADSLDGPGGKTGRARATLLFDRGKTSGHFSYHWGDGKWRLLGFNVYIPDRLAQEVVSRSETLAARAEAPAEIHALVRDTLERVRDGHSGAVYDEASPTFRQPIRREDFLELQDKRRRVLGRYVRILDTLQSWRNQSRTRARVTVLVEYRRARTPVTLGFIKLADQWQLAQYKVVMPRPRVPR